MGSIPIVGSVAGWQVRLITLSTGNNLTCEPATARGSGGYPSGQRGLTVNQLVQRLRRFESFTAHLGRMTEIPLQGAGKIWKRHALIAQLVEHALGKGGVMGSNPIEGS